MDIDRIHELLRMIENHTAEIRDLVGPRYVTNIEELKVAMAKKGVIRLEPDSVWNLNAGIDFAPNNSDIRLEGPAKLISPSYVFYVEARNVHLLDLALESASLNAAVLLGNNDKMIQPTPEQEPDTIILQNIVVQAHRGKRPIEVNARKVEIVNCVILDSYHPHNVENQAVWVGNSSGDVSIEGGIFEGGSECFMSGGDDIKMGVNRTKIRINRAEFRKNLEWRDKGIPVKNLIELKDATDVIISNCILHTCWQGGQAGEALMFTPVRGGQVRDVFVNNCEIYDVGAICNLTGVDFHKINTVRTTVTFNGGKFTTNKAKFGGRGNFILIDRGPEYIQITGADITIDGNSFAEIVGDLPVDFLRITNNRFNYGLYGIRIGGLNHGNNSKGLVKQIEIAGNTIIGAHREFRERYPNNTYQ